MDAAEKLNRKNKLLVDIVYFLTYAFFVLLSFSLFVVIAIMIIGIINPEFMDGLNMQLPVLFDVETRGVLDWRDQGQAETRLHGAIGNLSIASIPGALFFMLMSFRLAGVILGGISTWIVLRFLRSLRNGYFELERGCKAIRFVALIGIVSVVMEQIVIYRLTEKLAGSLNYEGLSFSPGGFWSAGEWTVAFVWFFVLMIMEVFRAGSRLNAGKS